MVDGDYHHQIHYSKKNMTLQNWANEINYRHVPLLCPLYRSFLVDVFNDMFLVASHTVLVVTERIDLKPIPVRF